MKRILSYLFLILALVSCEKGTVLHPQEPGEWGGYITFSTGIETKTPINENMRRKNFGVLAYSYTSNWATARPVSTPDLFYNQLVACDNNGICTYDSSNESGVQLKEWDLSKIYSFFAYYPDTLHNYIDISRKSKTDMPTVTYTFPFPNDEEEIIVPGNNNLVDLLTASSTDQTGRGSGKVAFNFEHRLFCFEILANNYNDNESIDITNLKLTLSGLKHNSITVPMMASDTRTEVVKTSTGVPQSVTFNISDASTTATIPSFNNGGTSFDLSKNCSENGDGYLMLIPQDGEITGEFTWDDMPTGEGITTSFTTNLNFQEGKKYSIIINFAGDAITIAIIEAGNWSVNDVETEFE